MNILLTMTQNKINGGKLWKDEEYNQLIIELKEGQSLKMIAEFHGRSEEAIKKMKLKMERDGKLNKIIENQNKELSKIVEIISVKDEIEKILKEADKSNKEVEV